MSNITNTVSKFPSMRNTVQKSREEIEALKASWLSDPSWDIEDTEGFEAHYSELKAYRLEIENNWVSEQEKKKAEFAATYGCSPQLAELLISMQNQIKYQDQKNYYLADRLAKLE